MKIELYCDVPARLHEKETQDIIRECGFTGIRVSVDKADGSPLIEPAEFKEIGKLYPMLRRRAVFWCPYNFDVAYCRRLWSFREYGDIVYDVEHQATSFEERACLAQRMGPAPGGIITTHPVHREASSFALVGTREMFRREIQALSTSTAIKRFGANYRPGQCQRHAFRRVQSAGETDPWLVLPLYAQQALGGVKSMETAFRAARELGVQKLSYWSLKHLLKNTYAKDFFVDVLPRLMEDDEDG